MGFFSGTKKTRSTSQLKPWLGAMPGLGEATGLVSRWVDQPREFFPGQTYAGMTPDEQAALEGLRTAAGAAPGVYRGFLAPTQAAFQQALGAPGQALGMGLQDVTQNPALMGAAQAIQAQVNRNLAENILPQLTTGAVGRGTLGGTRQQVAEGIAARGTSQALSEALADMYGQAWGQGLAAETQRYGAGLGAAGRAMGMAPGMAQFGMSPYTAQARLLQETGGIERAEEQRAINEAMARHKFAQDELLERGRIGLGLMQPLGAQFGEQETETRARSSPSTFSNLMQLGQLGASAFGAFGGMGGLGGMMGGMAPDPWRAGSMGMAGTGMMSWNPGGGAGYGGGWGPMGGYTGAFSPYAPRY